MKIIDVDFVDYLKYSMNKDDIFYSRSIEKSNLYGSFEIPPFDHSQWYTHTDEHWSYMIFRNKEFPAQGWKIHITAIIDEAQNLLFDVASFLILHKISFKFVPNIQALKSKNEKYADRAASGKFITVYPENTDTFIELLNSLKEITSLYSLGPYILNDKQWCESNVFFRYGGLKSIEKNVDGEKVLAIQKPDGTYITDKRVPYYSLPDFVEEPPFIVKNNTFPNPNLFKNFQRFNVIEVIHFSNAGGVYLAELKNQKLVLKEGRDQAGIDANGKDGFQRIRNEYVILKHLSNVDGVINVGEYFTSWRHNYFTEEYLEAVNLRTFIAKSFTYNSSNKIKTKQYFEKCVSIINQLKTIIKKIHEKGIAIGDLSLTNIMISEKDLKVTLIDFEAAKPLNYAFHPDVATPGFYSLEVNNFMEADWFAFYRIVRNLFLPINPVIDMAPQIVRVQNEAIERKFGKEVINLLVGLENEVSMYTNLFAKSPFLSRTLNVPERQVSLMNIDYYKRGLIKGILNNIDKNSLLLTKGDIRQHISPMGNYNIAYGAFGVLLSLIRSDESLKDYLKESMGEWLNITLPYMIEMSKQLNSDFGLFTGLSGIVTTIYELGYKEISLSILDNLNKERLELLDDISIFSGLSGIGLQFLAFYKITSENLYLDYARFICDKLIFLYHSSLDDLSDIADNGLLTGWSGAALFLWKYSLISNDKDAKMVAIKLMDKSFSSLSIKDEYQENVFVMDNSRDVDRLIPYMENGSTGIALVISEFQKDDSSYLNEKRLDIFNDLVESGNMFCSYNGGLISGYTGFITLANAVKNISGDKEMLETLLENLNNFLIKNDNDEILFPGDGGYKCSMDYSTGAAGVLLVLNDVYKKGKWGSWLPLPTEEISLFEL